MTELCGKLYHTLCRRGGTQEPKSGKACRSEASERQICVLLQEQLGDIGNLGVNFRFVPSLAALLLQGRCRAKTPIVGGQSGVSVRAARQIMICIRFIAPCAPPGAQEHNCGKDHQELSGETPKGTREDLESN